MPDVGGLSSVLSGFSVVVVISEISLVGHPLPEPEPEDDELSSSSQVMVIVVGEEVIEEERVVGSEEVGEALPPSTSTVVITTGGAFEPLPDCSTSPEPLPEVSSSSSPSPSPFRSPRKLKYPPFTADFIFSCMIFKTVTLNCAAMFPRETVLLSANFKTGTLGELLDEKYKNY